jgi:CarD family transcriptional regulator
MSTAKKSQQRAGFKTGEYVVYPAHGVGQVTSIEEQEIAGMTLELFVINFEQDKLTLRVPVAKVKSVGMRKLAEEDLIAKALLTVTGRARVKRTMWSRRAQEYEAKINSGDLIFISEVVRDLFRSDDQPEQSYSERQLFEQAMERMSRELSVVNKITLTEAVQLIEKNLAKSPRRGAKTDADKAEADKSDTDKPGTDAEAAA